VDEPEPRTVRAAIDGDLRAFEHLIRTYQAHVLRFLRHFLGDHALAEDVAQETFLRAFERLPTFRFQAKFSTWVFQVARNAGIDAVRARDRQARLARAARPPAAPSDPSDRAELTHAVAALSPKLREALLLVELLGLTYREAGVVLQVPEGTVKSRVFLARERLSTWLAGDEPGETRAGDSHR
jgi:RNA polymerase sigma-70 factor (ECF subfamily)